MSVKFLDTSGAVASPMQGWEPLVVTKAAIDEEIERLASAPPPHDGIRSARIVHPQATNPGLGLAPATSVTIHVLKPNESTAPIRHNSSQLSICIRGSGEAKIGSKRIAFGRHDVWNTPGMHPYTYRNGGTDLQVRLTYSNSALLEQLHVHHVEHMPTAGFQIADVGEKHEAIQAAKALSAPILLPGGAQLLTYEHLVSPEVVINEALHWRWSDIQAYREKLFSGDALKNKGRRGLLVLYNPATGRTVGITHNFFATMGFMPADVIDFPHRHSSNAINYALEGDFVSEVNGQRIRWQAGDIAYTAPSWSAHANGSENGGIAMTVQDHPFQIATESLVWQEGEDKPILLLGAQQGFESDDSIQLRGTR